MRKFPISLILCAVTSAALAQPASQPATQPVEASLRVFGVRINRQSPELQKQFRNRVMNDGQTGVQLQLMLSSVDELLPPPREAVTIETFVDDTYQSLLASPRENGYFPQPNPPVVSEDGHALLFTVQAPRGPADDADRIFVRGNVQTRVARGQSKVQTAELKVAAGAVTDVGPFHCTVNNLNDNGRTTVNVNLTVEGDTSLVRRVRVLSTTGRVLQDVNDNGGWNASENRSSSLNLNVPAGNEKVKLEFAISEKIETVKIPFEAQVDCGNTKAGPMEVIQSPTTVRPRSPRSRVWPPPPAGRVELPPTRSPMTFAAATTQPRDLKAAVDVFSLTIGKPAPEEVKTVQWTNPPALNFRAAGFTTLRLMVSAPNTILSVPSDSLNVSKFEDDTGAKLDTTVFQGTDDSYGNRAGQVPLVVSPDGQQVVLPFYLAAAPSPGATRCTIGGSFKAKVGINPHTDTSAELKLENGQSTKVGPYTFTIQQIRRNGNDVPMPYSETVPPVTVVLNVKGPISMIREVQLLDTAGSQQNRQNIQSLWRDTSIYDPTSGMFRYRSVGPLTEERTDGVFNLVLRDPSLPTAKLRVSYHEKSEIKNIPFEITTGIGL